MKIWKGITLAFIQAALLFTPASLFAEGDYMSEKPEVRIQNVLAKIRRGEPVRIASLGGSITTGFNSNPIATSSWAARVGEWFKTLGAQTGSNVTFANEGVSGTDSAFAVARVKNHILDLNIDLVILEFAMNDQWLEEDVRQRTYEGVIRQIMNNSETAILALYVNERVSPYSSQQYEQQPICEYYHIPFVSWKDCVFNDNPKANFDDFFNVPESVHPNNKGHESIASYIIAKLNSIWESLPKDSDIPKPVKELPKPLTDTGFEFATYYNRDNLTPVSNTDWESESPVHSEWVSHGNAHQGWQSNTPEAEIVFEVEGSSVGIMYAESDQFRDAQAWVERSDGSTTPRVILNCYQVSRQGYLGWAYREVVRSDKIEKFKLHVIVSRRAPKSAAGKYANITGIIAGGKLQ